MTVFHVAAGNVYGGIERMLATLAQTPGAAAHEFVLAFGGRLERELAAAGAAVYRLPAPRAARPLRIWRARRAFAAVLERRPPAVTIFHGAWPHAMLAPVARSHGSRIAFWQHAPLLRRAWPDRWARAVQPDLVIYNSRYTELHPAFPASPGRVMFYPVAAPAPLPAAARQDHRRALGAADEDVVVLLAARLEKWKGQTVLLEAARLLRGHPRLRYWIAGAAQSPGEADYFRSVEALAAAPELRERVTLLGQRDDVPLLHQLADVYCQPNLEPEPFGISVAEAMLAGRPCVISAGGGAAELLDTHSGIVTPAGDVPAVAAALDQLGSDGARRASMGRAAAVRAARLTSPAERLRDLDALLLPALAQ